ncbi:unnamed protein product, partial [Ectocarpus sp. 12 AP-2014]
PALFHSDHYPIVFNSLSLRPYLLERLLSPKTVKSRKTLGSHANILHGKNKKHKMLHNTHRVLQQCSMNPPQHNATHNPHFFLLRKHKYENRIKLKKKIRVNPPLVDRAPERAAHPSAHEKRNAYYTTICTEMGGTCPLSTQQPSCILLS